MGVLYIHIYVVVIGSSGPSGHHPRNHQSWHANLLRNAQFGQQPVRQQTSVRGVMVPEGTAVLL